MHPQLYQRVLQRAKPEREQNKRDTRRVNWWLFGENAPKLRRALAGLTRFVAVPDTSKFKPFTFLPPSFLPDVQVYCVVSDDAWVLGVLQSNVHQGWLRMVSPKLEDRPRWKPAICFDPFPFPACDESAKERIRRQAEDLDVHRKRVQAQYPDVTLTGMYNVLGKLRANEPLTEKEQRLNDLGLVSVLRKLHDELDAVVFEAYGLGTTLRSRAQASLSG